MTRAESRNLRAANEDIRGLTPLERIGLDAQAEEAHARRIRLASAVVATAILGAREAGLTPGDIAAAIRSEAGSPAAARAVGVTLRDIAGELAALLGTPDEPTVADVLDALERHP